MTKIANILFCFIFCLVNIFCHTDSKTKLSSLEDSTDSKAKTTITQPKQQKKYIHAIKELYLDTNSISLTDEGSFWLLYFEPGKVYFDFNPSCGYWFPTTLIDNKIVFNWAENMNCNFDRGLRKSFKGIKSPEKGKPFGEIFLLNDSMVCINYYYKDWVNKINEEERKSIDTLFPSRFKIIEL